MKTQMILDKIAEEAYPNMIGPRLPYSQGFNKAYDIAQVEIDRLKGLLKEQFFETRLTEDLCCYDEHRNEKHELKWQQYKNEKGI